MKILVTGGLGFIGSNFIRLILEQYPDYEVFNYDVITYAGNPENLMDLSNKSNYHFVKGDIRNFELLDYVVRSNNIEAIINFAAESHVDRSISNPNIFIETNIIGTTALLNVAKKNSIKKFVQISTDEVYGDLDFVEPGFTEQHPLKPSSPYSASKTSADLIVNAYKRTFGLDVNITRCSNNYGPYQFPEKLIPLMINNIKSGKKLPIYGDGKNVRDWIHVVDHCKGILAVLEKGISGEVYNFGGDAELSNIGLVETLIEKMGASKDLITFVRDRPGHDRRYAMDFSKAKKDLGWSPTYKFDNGIKQTIQWYNDNKKWMDNVISGDYQRYYKEMYGDK